MASIVCSFLFRSHVLRMTGSKEEFMGLEPNQSRKGIFQRIPVRYVVTAMGFLGFFNIYAMRVNLSVAMVAMVNNSVETSNVTPVVECSMLLDEVTNTTAPPKEGEYFWDSKTQGLILGSFFYGYVLTQLPGGLLAERFGGKWLFGIGVLVTAVFSLLTPLAASWGTAAFIVVRVIEGLGEGVTFPSMNALISQWSPKYERSRLSTIIYTGCQIGNVIAMPVSGVLSESSLFGGWPSVFYVFGTVGCIWFMFWIFLVYDTPEDHPRISKLELLHIQQEQREDNEKKELSIPWNSIFTSVPVWALIITHFGQNWGFLILLTELPTYLNNILHFNIEQNGFLSALPYLLQALFAWMASFLADRLRQSGRLKITTIRKIFNTIGFFGPAICLLGVTAAGCNPKVIVALISLALALNGFIYSGFNISHVDMSPDFAGTLYGITNTVSNLSGFLGPAVVGWATTTGQTVANWSLVFYVTSGVYIITALVFIVFGTADLQPWGVAPSSTKTEQRMVNLSTEEKPGTKS